MKPLTVKRFYLLVASFFAVMTTAHAGVYFTNSGGGSYSVKLDPITFTVTAAGPGAANGVVIEDFYTANATANGSAVTGSMLWSVNGGLTKTIAFNTTQSGTTGSTVNQMDPNDLVFRFGTAYLAAGAVNVVAGDLVTVWTNNLVFTYTGTTLVEAAGPYNAFLVTGTTAIAGPNSVSQAVPEPASLALLAFGLLGLGFSRRKQA